MQPDSRIALCLIAGAASLGAVACAIGGADVLDSASSDVRRRACSDGIDNDGDGLVDYPADPGCASLRDRDESSPLLDAGTPASDTGAGVDAGVPPSGDRLTWAPPGYPDYAGYRRITIPDTGPFVDDCAGAHAHVLDLCPGVDYVLDLGSRNDPALGGLTIVGGRNIVIIGGQVTAPDYADGATSWMGRCLTLSGVTGTAHVEGVRFVNCGDGVIVDSHTMTLELENVRFVDVHSPYEINHSDVIQAWRGPAVARIDKLTADFSTQGFLWSSVDGSYGTRMDQRRVSFRRWTQGGAYPTGPHIYVWHVSRSSDITCQSCWVEMGYYASTVLRRLQDGWGTPELSTGGYELVPYRVDGYDGTSRTVSTSAEHSAMPQGLNVLGNRQGDCMERIDPDFAGNRWCFGVPAGGDYVPDGLAGPAYVSPGYL